MNEVINSGSERTGEIELSDLWIIVWRGKWKLILIVLLCLILGFFYARQIPNVYKSEILLAPVEQSGSGNMNSIASQLGGLASMAGLQLGGAKVDKTTLAIEVLKSRDFLFSFIKRHELAVPLLGVKGWNEKSNSLEYDSDVYDSNEMKWVKEENTLQSKEPTYQELYKALTHKIRISQDKSTSMITVTVEHYSPYVAKNILDWLVEDINQEMKLRDLAEAEQAIVYLKSQLSVTSITEIKSILYQLIEEQVKTVMFTNIREHYAFQVVDNAVVPEFTSGPKRALIVLLAGVFGCFVGVFFLFFSFYLRAVNENRNVVNRTN